MIKALWTGASGMTTQQTSLDTISNNLANIATTGYKKETVQFSSLLYQKLQTDTTDSEGNAKPGIAQVGLGVRTSGIVSQFTQGTLQETGNTFDLAIEGNGFFMVRMDDGTTAYTRDGSFGLSIGTNGLTLANSAGYPVLDANGEEIVVDSSWNAANLSISNDGELVYQDADGNAVLTGKKIGLAQFNNAAGLLKQSGGLLTETANSGTPRIEGEDTALKASKIHAGYLEASNVETAEELVNMIVTQRAYEMSSKSIQAADEMLQQANNLRV